MEGGSTEQDLTPAMISATVLRFVGDTLPGACADNRRLFGDVGSDMILLLEWSMPAGSFSWGLIARVCKSAMAFETDCLQDKIGGQERFDKLSSKEFLHRCLQVEVNVVKGANIGDNHTFDIHPLTANSTQALHALIKDGVYIYIKIGIVPNPNIPPKGGSVKLSYSVSRFGRPNILSRVCNSTSVVSSLKLLKSHS
jgi:hypothetical protein